MSKNRAKNNKDDAFTELKIQGILERGKKLVEKINSNLYQDYNCKNKFLSIFYFLFLSKF